MASILYVHRAVINGL